MDALLLALDLGLSARDATVLLLLLAARLAPLAWLAAWIAPPGAPALVRTGTLGALVLALAPFGAAHAVLPAHGAALVLALLRELTLGLVLAVVTSVPVVAMEHVGRALDAWRPSRGAAEGTLTRLFQALAAAAFVAIGGLRVSVRALAEGLSTLPLGAPLATDDAQTLALGGVRILATAITFAVSLAAPALVALVIAELGIALAVRAARLGRALDSALGLRSALVLAAALLAVAAALPELPALTRWAIDQSAAIQR